METGNKVTIEGDGWRVTIEHLDVMQGNANDVYDLMRSSFRAVFSSELEKEYFDE